MNEQLWNKITAVILASGAGLRFRGSVAAHERTIDAGREASRERRGKARNALWKGSVQFDLNRLKRLKATLSQKPDDVKTIEAVVLSDMAQENQAVADLGDTFKILHAQVALMKTAATTIDDWLTIDITVTKDQADRLEKAFFDAKGALGSKPAPGGAQ